MKRLGITWYLLELQGLADELGVPAEEFLGLLEDIMPMQHAISDETHRNGAFLSALSQLALLKDGEVRPLEDIEGEAIRFARMYYRGHMSEVARRLKIGRSTLYRKIEAAEATETA